jgi:hypothetical protein
MSVVEKPDGTFDPQQGNANGDQYVMGRGDALVAMVRDTAVVADEGYMIVDLSDTTNFPHTNTTNVRLYGLDISLELDSDGTGTGVLYIGVVTEVDATDGSVDWFLVYDLETFQQSTDEVTRLVDHPRWPGGLDLTVSAGVTTKLLTATTDSGQVTWQTDVTLDSPYSSGSAAGAGDLVAFWDETADGASVDFAITAIYTTE